MSLLNCWRVLRNRLQRTRRQCRLPGRTKSSDELVAFWPVNPSVNRGKACEIVSLKLLPSGDVCSDPHGTGSFL